MHEEPFHVLVVASSGGHVSRAVDAGKFLDEAGLKVTYFICENQVPPELNATVHEGYWPVSRHPLNLARNTARAVRIIRTIKPDCIFSTGAAIGISAFIAGRMLGVRLVFAEAIDFLSTASKSAALAEKLGAEILVHDVDQLSNFTDARWVGPDTR